MKKLYLIFIFAFFVCINIASAEYNLADSYNGSNNFRYIGKPIDYVIFEPNKVVFLEVKTGSSQLNDNEINLKRLIDNKQVYYEVVRI